MIQTNKQKLISTFEITIQNESNGCYPVVVDETHPGELQVHHEGQLKLNSNDRVELKKQTDLRDYGTLLGNALFQGAVRLAFIAARAASPDHLRVLLNVEAPDLAKLHWEWLCAPRDEDENVWSLLALNQRVPFSRYLSSSSTRRYPLIGRQDLRALLVVASPEDLADYRGDLQPFNALDVVAHTRAALHPVTCDVLAFTPDAVGPPTLDALATQLTNSRYTLLHIVCHGRYSSANGGKEIILYLAQTDNQTEQISGSQLVQRLDNARGRRGLPHFIFLTSCETARPASAGTSGNLAQHLIRELGIPAVIAMTDQVSMATANDLARAFYPQLLEHGNVDQALVEACAGFVDRYDITVPALFSRLRGQPLFSDDLIWLSNATIVAGLDGFESFLIERAPTLSENPQWHAANATLRRTQDADPTTFSSVEREEHTQALATINNLCNQVLGISFDAFAAGKKPLRYDNRPPFRGLNPFRFEDREFFFGREALVKELKQKLVAHRFLAILGSSGSGKSSLVLAGLVPALQAQDDLAYLTPSSNPLAQLEASLSVQPTARSLLVVDQFEELFTHCKDISERETFIDLLMSLIEQTRVVITMRVDFWNECSPYNALSTLMEAHHKLIAPMDATELRRAMELQAAKVGLRFEMELSKRILDDIQGEPGAMPLLQHALQELWEQRHGYWLCTEEYEALGGVQHAIARTADDVYGQLVPEDQERVRNIFVRLTRLDEDNITGEEYRDTRRRVTLATLAPVGEDLAVTKDLVARLATRGLVVTNSNPTTDQEEVEVVHEALIRYWPRLRNWLDEDRANLRLRQRIGEAAKEWEGHGHDSHLLALQGPWLKEAETLAKQPGFPLNTLEREYLDACIMRREVDRNRELMNARNLRGRAIAALLFGLIALILMVVAIWAALQATQAQKVAETRARVAHAQELAAKAMEQVGNDPELGILLAMEAVSATLTQGEPVAPQAEDALHQAILRSHLYGTLRIHAETEPGPSNYFVGGAIWSPDGQTIAMANSDNIIRIWNVITNHERVALRGHTGPVTDEVWSPDSKTIVTTSADHTARLWNVSTGQLSMILQGHTDEVLSAAWSPDGYAIVTTSKDDTARIWDAATGQTRAVLQGHSDQVLNAAWSPDGHAIVTASKDGTARIWDATTGQLRAILHGHTDEVLNAAWSPDGHAIVTASKDGTARIWDATTDQLRAILQGHTDMVLSAIWSANGQSILSNSADGTIRIWNATAGQVENIVAGRLAVWSPDGKTISFIRDAGIVHFMDVATNQERFTLQCATHPQVGDPFSTVGNIAWSPDGTRILTVDGYETIRIWGVFAGQERITLRGHADEVVSAAWSPDGHAIVTASKDDTARIWNAATGQTRAVLQGHSDQVLNAAWSPDGRAVLLVSKEGAQIWDSISGQLDAVLDLGWPAVWSPDGRTIAGPGSGEGDVELWDVATGQVRFALHTGLHIGPVTNIGWSPDSRAIITNNLLGDTAEIWNIDTSRIRAVLQGHIGLVPPAWSPDGNSIVTISSDSTSWTFWNPTTGGARTTFPLPLDEHVANVIWSHDSQSIITVETVYARVWNADTNQIRLVLLGHEGFVEKAVWAPDDRTIVTVSDDGTAKVWDAFTGQLRTSIGSRKSPVTDAAWSPNGEELIITYYDGTSQIYIIDINSLLELAQLRVNRVLNDDERLIYLGKLPSTPQLSVTQPITQQNTTQPGIILTPIDSNIGEPPTP